MNNVSIALKLSDFELDPSYISNLLMLTPTDDKEKGQEFYIGPPNNRLKKVYESNYWEYRIHIKNNHLWLKVLIDQFVKEIILERKSLLLMIKDKCCLELYVGVEFSGNDSLDSYHFDLDTLRLFSELSIEIDIDQRIG